MRRRRATCIASLLLLAACGKEDPVQAPESDYVYAPPRPHRRQTRAGVRYADVTPEAGIDFVHENGARGKKYLPETMGSGVGMLDYDLDGDLDLLFVQSRHWAEGPQPTMRLFRNEGKWRFTDVTREAGLAVPCYGMGLAIADYDADGDPDVYVTALGPNLLFRNEGGRFARVAGAPDGGTWTDEHGRAHPSWSTGAAWYDADSDGDLDLLVVSYVRWTIDTDIYAQLVEGVKSYARPQLYEGDSPRLYLQQADHSFVDATEGSGLDRTEVRGKSLAVCLDDFNGDGRTDIFVANDTVQNFLFLGRGAGKYEESAVSAAVGYDDTGQARGAMGVDVVDWRNDGRLSIAIGNFSEEPVSLYTVSRRTEASVLFEDAAREARVGHPTLLPLTFGLRMLDADLDGWCDLVLANGHIEPSITRLRKELQHAQTPQYFRNLEGRRFADVSRDAGPPFQERIVGRGLAAGDLDADGDLDLVFTANAGRPSLLRCDLQTDHRPLRLTLRRPGTRNPEALGAVVKVTAGGVTQRRVVRTGGSYLSQGELTLTFGLGQCARADAVVVRWPGGETEEHGPLRARPQPHLLEPKP
ncbi:MAG: CRTAC1 family protein [Planctomycetota bacterium]|jgi:hypothetical protein